jgi:sugar (pentulose or hexulose) kinase
MGREMTMFAEAKTMTQRFDLPIGRRDVLRVLTGAAAAAAAGTAQLAPAAADSESDSEKRKARYQPDSPEVQTFYRVNRYPAR